MASQWPRKHSATLSAMLAALPDQQECARAAQACGDQGSGERRDHIGTQCAIWLDRNQALIASVSPVRRPASCCRTIRAQIFPHRLSLCGENGEKLNDNKVDFFRWWAVTDQARQ